MRTLRVRKMDGKMLITTSTQIATMPVAGPLIACALVLLPVLETFAQPSPVQTCIACHGARGEGNAAAGFPRLAGQPQSYIARQLDAYVDGRRQNPVMNPIAATLTSEQRGELSAYYAQLGAPSGGSAGWSATSTARGASAALARTLATKGDDSRRLEACENCHGPGGAGYGNVNPYLAGLGSTYLEAALREWREGTRKTDPSEQMVRIGKALSDAEIQAIAAYYGKSPVP
jgi:cytochrome c553